MPRTRTALRALAVLAGAGPLAAPAAGAQPAGFFGIVPQTPLQGADWNRIGAAGLGVRLPVRWDEIEKRRGEFEFEALDAAMTAAAARGVSVMPQIGGTPAWLGTSPARPPLGKRGLEAWRKFLRRLVLRYGPRGSFWTGGGRANPVHRWQIWNEPNFGVYWAPRPSPRGYVRLLRASAGAIRSVDPGARVVAAGLAPIEQEPPPWEFLAEMYRIPGARASFDIAALHPYIASLASLDYEIQMTRRVMAANGDGGTPLLISEMGVASDAERPTSFDMGPHGQARFLERSFSHLFAQRKRWRISGVYWFAWTDVGWEDPTCPFCKYAGLFDVQSRPKPAWRALLRVVRRYGSEPVR